MRKYMNTHTCVAGEAAFRLQDESFVVAADASLWIRITMWGLAAESARVTLGAHNVAVAGSMRTDTNKRARYIMLRISVAALRSAAQLSEIEKSSSDVDATAVSDSTLAAASAIEDNGSPEAAAWLVSLATINMPLVMDVSVAGHENVRVRCCSLWTRMYKLLYPRVLVCMNQA